MIVFLLHCPWLMKCDRSMPCIISVSIILLLFHCNSKDNYIPILGVKHIGKENLRLLRHSSFASIGRTIMSDSTTLCESLPISIVIVC